MIVAVLVFGVSAVLFGASVVDAVRVDSSSLDPGVSEGSPALVEAQAELRPASEAIEPAPMEDLETAPSSDEPGPLPGIIYPKVTEREILDAVNQDMFQPDRTPNLNPYLLPSERPEPVQQSRNNRRQRQPELRLVGTALAGNQALALIQLEDSLPVLFALGETVEGYTLASVTDGSITLAREEAEFTYPVTEPDRGRSSNNRDRNTRDRASNAEREAQALQQRLQQALRGLNQQGAGAIQFYRAGGAAGEGQVIQLQPGAVMRGALPGGGRAAVTIRGRGGGGGGLP
jgi:hypothetical protein